MSKWCEQCGFVRIGQSSENRGGFQRHCKHPICKVQDSVISAWLRHTEEQRRLWELPVYTRKHKDRIRSRISDPGSRILDPGSRILDPGSIILIYQTFSYQFRLSIQLSYVCRFIGKSARRAWFYPIKNIFEPLKLVLRGYYYKF